MKVATAVIERSALRHNLKKIQQLAPQSCVIAVVKGNAYGHGAVEVANTLDGLCDYFGVARLSEAIVLRDAGIKTPIVLLEGCFSQAEVNLLEVYCLETIVHSIEQVEALEQSKLTEPVSVWLKLDTGMHRLGVRPEQFAEAYHRLCACQNIYQPINFITHLSCSDDPSSPVTSQQILQFEQLTAGKEGLKSVTASAGILMQSAAHYDVIRPGLILYGASPFGAQSSQALGLCPAMTLTSVLIAVRKHSAGEAVGYAGQWVSDKETCLGVVAMGYADGYPQQMAQGTPVLINGRYVPLVGRVSMDMLVVDLGINAIDRVGDEVILWGDGLPLETVAEYGGVSSYELIARLTQRVRLTYQD